MAQIDPTDEGFQVDAELIAEGFGLTPDEVNRRMRDGRMTSRCEKGMGEDAGRWRLSVRCGNRRWQAIVEADGTVGTQRTEVIPSAPKNTR